MTDEEIRLLELKKIAHSAKELADAIILTRKNRDDIATETERATSTETAYRAELLNEIHGFHEFVENPEFKQVEIDEEKKIVSYISDDDTRHDNLDNVFHKDVEVHGTLYAPNIEQSLAHIASEVNEAKQNIFKNGEDIRNITENDITSLVEKTAEIEEAASALSTQVASLPTKDDVDTSIKAIDAELRGLSDSFHEFSDGYTEFAEVKIDADGHILESTGNDGERTYYTRQVFNGGIKAPEFEGLENAIDTSPEVIDSDEFIEYTTDEDGKILAGIIKDGTYMFFSTVGVKKIHFRDGTEIGSAADINSIVKSLTQGSDTYTSDGVTKEINTNGATIYPITQAKAVYNIQGENLEKVINGIKEAIDKKLTKENGVITYELLDGSVQSLIANGGSGGSGGFSFITKEGDLKLDNSGVVPVLGFGNKSRGNGMGIKYDYPDSDMSDFLSDENTVYVIRYSHTSTAEQIDVGYNSVLLFIGGAISASIKFNNNKLLGNVNLKGSTFVDGSSISNDEFDASWVCNMDGDTDDCEIIENIFNVCTSVYFPKGIYYLADRYVLNYPRRITFTKDNIALRGDGDETVFKVKFPLIDKHNLNCFMISGKKNCSVKKIKFDVENKVKELYGDIKTGDSIQYYEHANLFFLNAVKGFTMEECTVTDYTGDIIYVAGGDTVVNPSTDIAVRNNVFNGDSLMNRNAISFISCIGADIYGNTFKNMTSVHNPGCIDIEPNREKNVVRDINIHGNTFQNGNRAAVVLDINGVTPVSNILINSNFIDNCYYGIHVKCSGGNFNSLVVKDNFIGICTYRALDFNVSKDYDKENAPTYNWIVKDNIIKMPVDINKFFIDYMNSGSYIYKDNIVNN